ncbi:phosphoribosylformylglycinamidine cyclo-ligase [uncultured Methanoregula sp.]|uniref:phosphoribosylformylglycinamidine cyclo-ligase n=1 Tax=uncultured Methanoregula sp. TaxID=1005933 RepID=UPI002AAC4205|nr:phosphoribosylformylglycinamidine cyclo-ligase [uncultured Methanoregula sp.]
MNNNSYAAAGVDIDLEATAIKSLIKNLTFKRKGSHKMMGSVGHFAGLIDFGEMALALTTDGVGTKMLVADQMEDWSTVGIDCMAMNVNDLYVMNVEPVAFVDYIATDKLSIEKMAQIGIGLNEGAKQANVDIVGGETASLKGLVNGLDLAGTCLGMQKKDKIIAGEKIRPGDKIIGVPSTGVHSNGLSLARRVVEKYAGYDKKFKGRKTFGQELLTPTRIYHESLAVAASCTVHGMCHITGGGLLNFKRLSKYGFLFDTPITPPEIFSWIQKSGDIAVEEMYRTFNMGMGYAYVVPKKSVPGILKMVKGAQVVGEVVQDPGAWIGRIEIT